MAGHHDAEAAREEGQGGTMHKALSRPLSVILIFVILNIFLTTFESWVPRVTRGTPVPA